MFLSSQNKDFDGFLLIGPDAEGACPSDLCGMNGHESLAKRLSKHECDYVRKFADGIESGSSTNAHGPESKCRRLHENSSLPIWLRENDTDICHGPQTTLCGTGGISRMKSALTVNHDKLDSKIRHDVEKAKPIHHQGNLADID